MDRTAVRAVESIKSPQNRIPCAESKIMEALHRFKHVRYVVICCEAMYLNCRSLN